MADYFNGALFGSFDIEGGVTLRRCRVAHAFNVLRMDLWDAMPEWKNPPRSRPPLREIGSNRDVLVQDCDFAFIRDNVIEPEVAARGWRVLGNRMLNC
ncbi:MAG: hypothetical protein AAF192_10475, partial [Pseudomonadota bacterium]